MSTEYNEVQYPAAPGHDWDNWKYDIHLAVPHINHWSHTTCFIPPQLLTSSQSAPHTLSCEAKLKYWINWSDQSDRSKCQKLKWIVMYSNNSVDMLTRMTTKESTAMGTTAMGTTAPPQPPSSQQQLYQLYQLYQLTRAGERAAAAWWPRWWAACCSASWRGSSAVSWPTGGRRSTLCVLL